jgi:hypothetical protein
MADLKIYETGDGGDFNLTTNDFQLIEGFQNMPYLSFFGGNPGHPTTGAKPENQEAFDWWGNFYLSPNNTSVWFNSYLENVLKNTALGSSGLREIEAAVEKDLKNIRQFAKIDLIDVELIYVDRLKITVKITEPTNSQSNEFTYIWNATEQELSIVGGNNVNTFGNGVSLDYVLNYEL